MIRLDNISKQIGHQILFMEASAALQKGEKVGLVGPNGAGKTTTLEMIETIREIDDGSAEVDGLDVSKNTQKVKKIIVGTTRKGSVSNFLKRTDMLTEMMMAFTDIRMFAFLSAISLSRKLFCEASRSIV